MIFSILGHHRAISSIVLFDIHVHISSAFMSPFVKYFARLKTKPLSSKGRFEIIYHNVFSLEFIVILMSLNNGRPVELGKRLPWIKLSLSVTSWQLDVLSTQYFKTPKWNSSSPAQWSVNKATRMPDICKMYPVIRKHDSFWAVVILVREQLFLVSMNCMCYLRYWLQYITKIRHVLSGIAFIFWIQPFKETRLKDKNALKLHQKYHCSVCNC